MHLYAPLCDILPKRVAGVVFALIYALLLVATVFLAQLSPADFDYGRS